MVINSKTMQPLHELTAEGKIQYQEFIASKADELLVKKDHPVIYFFHEYFRLLSKKYESLLDEIKQKRI